MAIKATFGFQSVCQDWQSTSTVRNGMGMSMRDRVSAAVEYPLDYRT